MGIGFKRVLILIFLLCLTSCMEEEHAAPPPDYGEEYFQMECIWADPNDGNAVWRCSKEVETDLVSGYLLLQFSEPEELYFCGENLLLHSGIAVYDNLIRYLTEDNFDCLHISEDTQKGNEFDWMWDRDNRLLQIIWRPETSSHKLLSLVIEDGEYYQTVPGAVYYKVLSED